MAPRFEQFPLKLRLSGAGPFKRYLDLLASLAVGRDDRRTPGGDVPPDRTGGECTMLRKGAKQMLAEANAAIETVPVDEAIKLAGDPDVALVDIRETVERQKTGTAKGATQAPRGFLEFHADPESPMHLPVFSSGKRILLFCASGGRSALAAKTLGEMGVPRVAHIQGGFTAWKQAGGPTED
jgi:rhodanese-related sulfurtransferase